MPSKSASRKARNARRQGKAPSTQAGAYVQEEMRRTKGGTQGVKSRKQAVAIGLSKARRDGVKLPRNKRAGTASRRRKASPRTSKH